MTRFGRCRPSCCPRVPTKWALLCSETTADALIAERIQLVRPRSRRRPDAAHKVLQCLVADHKPRRSTSRLSCRSSTKSERYIARTRRFRCCRPRSTWPLFCVALLLMALPALHQDAFLPTKSSVPRLQRFASPLPVPSRTGGGTGRTTGLKMPFVSALLSRPQMRDSVSPGYSQDSPRPMTERPLRTACPASLHQKGGRRTAR